MRFDCGYKREDWVEYLGEKFRYKVGVIPFEKNIIEKHSDCLDNSSEDAIVWLGDLNIDEDVGVYEIKIKNTKLTTRVKISKLCADIIRAGSRHAFGKGIFFILYSNDDNNFNLQYRISYVKYDKKADENFEIKKDLSDPKRFTYLLGEGAKVKTATSRLTKEAFSTVKKIEEAFSVEPVNKEFYNGIKKSFDKIYKDVLKNFENDNQAKEFSLRFLGRALFCWFLREKDLIPKEIFDFETFAQVDKNYYKEVLEELFFNVLNARMEERKITSKIIKKYEKQIPFLNGGLFSKQKDDEKVKTIDSEIIKELFEFFSLYNFTVDESAPFDIEISIEPEMLGRIFENLLAEINPSTSESARKETGSFYTPREIVDYMVCESIKLYLKKKVEIDDKKIENIFSIEDKTEWTKEESLEILKAIHEMKILDIACGSGAFPMGVLSRVFNIIDKLDGEHEYYKDYILSDIQGAARKDFEELYNAKKFNYAYKLDMLQRMIHGVDIQPIAIEISRLRAFLSLIVDEEKDDNQKSNLGIKALPNLEFNFISANSLISLENKSKEQMELKDGTTDGIIKQMRAIAERYFIADSVEKKKGVKRDFEAFKYRTKNDKDGFLDEEDKEKFLSWNPFENKSAEFFDSEIQFGIKSFDIVIGNPPYIQIQSMNKDIKESYKNAGFKSFASTGDIYQLFYERSLNLIGKNGVVSLITSNKWMRAGYGASTREYFYNNANVFKIIDLGAGRFQSATVDVNIIFYGKNFEEKAEGERLFDAVNYKNDLEYLNLIRIWTQGAKAPLLSEVVTANLGKEWVIMNKVERSIFEKINKHKALKDWDISIYTGILTGYNEAFIINEETKNMLISKDKKNKKVIKPLLVDDAISKYEINFNNKYMINIHNGIKSENIPPININDYKEIKKYIDNTVKEIEEKGNIKRRGGHTTANKGFHYRDNMGITPYNLRNCAYLLEFDKPKIVWKQTSKNQTFMIDTEGYYLTITGQMIVIKNNDLDKLKYILSILNSKLFKYYMLSVASNLSGVGIRWIPAFIEKVPIPKVDKKTEDKIVGLVDKVIDKKRSKVDSLEEEREIDRLVYGLYGLSEEEIKIIEKCN